MPTDSAPPARELAAIIRDEIARTGAMPWARFMELALYQPEHGYYERATQNIGRRGDFFTSVSVGPLFGELLAAQFADWLDELPPPPAGGALQLVEAGAHNGQLAHDVLAWFQRERPAQFSALEYCLLEPSPRRQAWQAETLRAFGGKVRWVRAWEDFPAAGIAPHGEAGEAGGAHAPSRVVFRALAENPDGTDAREVSAMPMHAPKLAARAHPATREGACAPPVAASGIHGIIFSNELLDAFPVRRLGWDAAAATWFEWAVRCDGDAFAWTRLPLADDPRDLFHPLVLTPELTAVLPNGFTTEVSPAAVAWWRQAAAALRHGKLLTLDYGFSALDFFSPSRASGTLRAYAQHRSSTDLLAAPGQQDLTAHVNFTALQAAGETAGLHTEGRPTQSRFLTAIAARAWSATGSPTDPAVLRQFQTLTHPDHLGRSFSVLLQSRRPPSAERGMAHSDRREETQASHSGRRENPGA